MWYAVIVILSLLCACTSLILWDKHNKKEQRYVHYILLMAVFEIIAWFSVHIFEFNNNLPGLHIFTLFQFILTTLFFGACFKELGKRFPLMLIIVAGSVGIILNTIFIQPIYTYNSYSKTLVELYIIASCFTLFIYLLRDKKHDHKAMKPAVAFISALFLNSAVSFIIYIYSNEILSMKSHYQTTIWNLKLMINYVSYLIIIFGLVQIGVRRNMTRSM